MRWREKFFWWKIYENELGDNIPHTLCIPQPQPFYNFFPPPPWYGPPQYPTVLAATVVVLVLVLPSTSTT